MDTEFDCAACYESLTGTAKVIEGSTICGQCIKRIFDDSMCVERNFKPRWNKMILDPWDFRDVLSARFVIQFERKQSEWRCPDKERIYCRQKSPPLRPEECGNFLKFIDKQKCQQCEKCKSYTCMRCRGCFRLPHWERAGDSVAIEHECDPSIEEKIRESAFEGLQRGKHYQVCPNPVCELRIELKDACQHMTCPCGTEFCYLCGRRATEGSGHWDVGSACTLYPDGGHTRPAHPVEDIDAEEDAYVQWQLEMIAEQEAGGRYKQLDHEEAASRQAQDFISARRTGQEHRNRIGRHWTEQVLDNGSHSTHEQRRHHEERSHMQDHRFNWPEQVRAPVRLSHQSSSSQQYDSVPSQVYQAGHERGARRRKSEPSAAASGPEDRFSELKDDLTR